MDKIMATIIVFCAFLLVIKQRQVAKKVIKRLNQKNGRLNTKEKR